MLRFVMVLLPVVVALTDCAAKEGEPIPFGQEGPSFWMLNSLSGRSVERDPVLYFEEDSVSLVTPCDRRSWEYSYDAGTIKFFDSWEKVGWCGGTPSPLVDSFDRVLPTVSAVRVSNGELKPLTGDGKAVIAATELRSSGIENRGCYVDAYFDGTSLATTREKFTSPVQPIVTFVHGGLRGSLGCGRLIIGTYALDGRQITVSAGLLLVGMGKLRFNEL
jgi:hypothetical protein